MLAVEKEGKPGAQSSQQQQQQQQKRQHQKQASKGMQAEGIQGAHRYMPLPKDRYAEEVRDMLQVRHVC